MRDPDALPLVEAQVRRFLRQEVDAARLEAAGRISDAMLAQVAELGLFGLSIPERWGGLELGLSGCCSVVTQIARADRSLATTIGLHNGLGVRPLIERGSDALRARWLPRLAAGEIVASFAATEAGAGSDLTRASTRATIDGDHAVVDGEKHFVTNGGFAGLFTVLARTPDRGGARGQALVLVPRDAPGVTVGPEEHKLGLRASSTVTVRFDGVRVPADHVLGEPGAGASDALAALEWGRTLMAAGCVGTAVAAIDATIEHVRTRRQFGRPLLSFPSVQQHVATMLRESFAMQALVTAAGRAERRCGELAHLATAAKVVCSEGAFDLCDRAVQLHGGIGYLEEAGVARMLRDARVTRIFEGANEVLLARLGTALYASESSSRHRRLHDDDAALAARFDDVDAHLEAALIRAREVHGLGGVRAQTLLSAFARADIALLAASACLASRSPDRAVAIQAAEDQLERAEGWILTAAQAPERSARDALLVEQWKEQRSPARTSTEVRA